MTLGMTWLALPLGAACLLVAAFHGWLLAARREPALSSAAHLLMGVGMAAMFLPALDPLPAPAWVALFAVSGAWFGASALREGSLFGVAGHHVVGAAAMLFMLLGGHDHAGAAVAGDAGHAHHGGGAEGPGLLVTVLALAFAGWYAADVVRTLLHRDPALADPALVGAAAPVRTPVRVPGGPRHSAPPRPLVETAHIVMAVAMVAMLLGMA